MGGSAQGDDAVTQTSKAYVDSLVDHGLLTAESSSALALVVIHQAIYSLGRAKIDLDNSLELWRSAFRKGSADKAVLLDLQATLPLILHALESLQHPSVTNFMQVEPRSRPV
jgi:hypothetical protein